MSTPCGNVEMLNSSTEILTVPTNYYELFSIIGIEKDWYQKEPIIIKRDDNEKQYTVYQYPDSVWLKLEIKENIIYYGYYR